MEKRKKSQKKANNLEKKRVKNEILNELALSLKSLKHHKEKSQREGLEDLESQKAENNEEVNLNEFENFDFDDFARISGLNRSQSSSPILEKIAISEHGPVFVGGIRQGNTGNLGEENTTNDFKYSAGNNNNGEPKYIDSDSHIRTNLDRVDMARIGRENIEPWKDINTQAFFEQASESRQMNFQPATMERVWEVDKADFERAREKNPQQRGGMDTKYDKYKPDLPKSR